MKKRSVSKEAVAMAAKKSTLASARLERRVVPFGFQRSPQVEKYLESSRETA